MSLTIPLQTPNPEQVCIAWLNTLSDVRQYLVAGASTSLPKTWTKPVFILVSAIPSSSSRVMPERNPVIQLDFYAEPGKYGEVFTAAEMVRDATFTQFSIPRLATKAGFKDVRLGDVSISSDPVLVRPDEATKARAQLDVELTYVVHIGA